LRVVDSRRWRPYRRAMTRLAGIRSRDMIFRFARVGRAVVAADAVTRNARVIEQCRAPRIGVMAGFATVICRYMIGRFTSGGTAVVTTETIAGNAGVIEMRSGPKTGVVADLAIVARLNMTDRLTTCR